jgi:hypothetical protein
MLWLMAASLLLSATVPGAPPPEKRRGRLDHAETLDTEHSPSFRWHLASSPDSRPRLLFEGVDLVTVRKVRMYQTVVEKPAAKDGENSEMEYEVVPGEFIRGETYAEQSSTVSGPLPHETFTVNGVDMTTDGGGVAIDETQSLLGLFDDLSTTSAVVRASHKTRGGVLLKLTRNVVKRYTGEAKQPEDLKNSDILASLGLDFGPKRTSGRKGVVMSLDAPDRLEPGQSFDLSLTVSNQGTTETSSVLGRIFSRHEWLHGRLFYIGSVQPGTSLTFSRHFAVPADAKPGLVFAGVGFWDLLGTIPNKGIVLKMELAPATGKMPAKAEPAAQP